VALAGAAFAHSSGGPNAQLVNQDRVYGGGAFGPGCVVPDINFCIDYTRNFAIDAHATAGGNAAFGDATYGAPLHDQHHQVTCLSVDGNKAAVGGIVTQADRPSAVGLWFVQFFVDRGTPAFGERDLASLVNYGPPDPADWPPGFPYICPSPDTGSPAFGLVPSYLPLAGGDLVVQDAR